MCDSKKSKDIGHSGNIRWARRGWWVGRWRWGWGLSGWLLSVVCGSMKGKEMEHSGAGCSLRRRGRGTRVQGQGRMQGRQRTVRWFRDTGGWQ